MLKRCVLFMSMVLLGLVQTIQTPAQTTQERDRVSSPFSMTEFSPCTNEEVALEGVVTVTSEIVVDANGGIHTQFRIQAHGTGQGLISATKYQFHQNSSSVSNIGNSCQFENSGIEQEFLLISKGAGVNLKFFLTFHITINANCEVTAAFSNFRFQCKG